MKTVTSRQSSVTSRWGVPILIAVPAIGFFLHDFVFQLPDNQHEASVGFFATMAALLAVWGLTGFLAARGRGWRVVRGAFSASLSMVMLALTLFVLNQAFPDRMSYEPDRIRAFQRSGYPTMSEYVRAQHEVGPLPLLLAVAAVTGAVGGALEAVRRWRSLG